MRGPECGLERGIVERWMPAEPEVGWSVIGLVVAHDQPRSRKRMDAAIAAAVPGHRDQRAGDLATPHAIDRELDLDPSPSPPQERGRRVVVLRRPAVPRHRAGEHPGRAAARFGRDRVERAAATGLRRRRDRARRDEHDAEQASHGGQTARQGSCCARAETSPRPARKMHACHCAVADPSTRLLATPSSGRCTTPTAGTGRRDSPVPWGCSAGFPSAATG